MYLTSLEINGFKSFDRKGVLKFTSPISSIVGPNGSGKSNVAEAFRFVLGEQSLKSMRGKRGEDLIFNGGTGTTRCNRASVKVTFNNNDRMLNIDFDEVVIERVVNRDSTNEYYINGSQVRLKDIAELLAGAHIGASGHHIISQGEADRILTASIRDRREMVEDALGLKLYQYKKVESLRKLEKTDANIKEVESLRREIAPHINFLRKQVEKIQKTEEMRAKLRALYKEYLYREELYIAHERARLKNERRAPQDELDRLDRERKVAENLLSQAQGSNQMGGQIVKIQHDIDAVRVEKDEVLRSAGRTEGELQSLKRLIQKEHERAAREENKTIYLRDVETFAKNVENEIAEIDEAGKSGKHEKVAEILAKVRGYIKEFLTVHRGSTDTTLIAESEKDIAKLEHEKSATLAKVEAISEKEKHLIASYNQLRAKVEAEKDSGREAEKQVFKIAARQNELRGVLATIRAREDSMNLEDESLKREIAEAYALVGREAVDTKSVRIVDDNDNAIAAEVIATEPRSVQESRRKEIERIKIRVEDAGIGNSSEVMKEFTDAEERDAFLQKELADLHTTRESLLTLIADLDARLNVEFKEGIVKINSAFQKFFELMFGGGTARLDVIKEQKRKRKSDTDELAEMISAGSDGSLGNVPEAQKEEDAEEGIEISVSLPRKKVKGLMMLSGGERALTSIALLFAISQVKPPPFIILDETDAALDEANSKKYGDMIENLSKYSQLILITHNRETMSRAGVLYGVTMGSDGASRLLSIAFEDAVKVAK